MEDEDLQLETLMGDRAELEDEVDRLRGIINSVLEALDNELAHGGQVPIHPDSIREQLNAW